MHDLHLQDYIGYPIYWVISRLKLKKNITYCQISKGNIFLKLDKVVVTHRIIFFFNFIRENNVFSRIYWTERNTKFFFSFKREMFPNEFWNHCDVIFLTTVEYEQLSSSCLINGIIREPKKCTFLILNYKVAFALGH